MTKPQIDFYLLKPNTWRDCYPFVCQLASKAYQKGHSLTLSTTNHNELKHLSTLLWTLQPESFIPHQLDNKNTSTSLNITSDKTLNNTCKLLLNIKLTDPEDPANWQRLLQIIPNEPQCLATAREHYKFYQQQGCEINTHQLQKSKH